MMLQSCLVFILIAADMLVPLQANKVQQKHNEVERKQSKECYDKMVKDLQPLGCFFDDIEDRVLDTLLVSYRDVTSHAYSRLQVDWHIYDTFLMTMLRECYETAAALGYSYLGLAFYGECWVGKKLNIKSEGQSDNCITGDFRTCEKDTACVGESHSIFVYKIEQYCPAGLVKRVTCPSTPGLNCSHQSEIPSNCIPKLTCACPIEKPFYANGKCYASFQCPKPLSDGSSSLPIGHNFVLSGPFSEKGFAFGMHISALKLNPHWYHAVVLLKADSFCAQISREIYESDKLFFNMRFNKSSMKLVDLLRVGRSLPGILSDGRSRSFKKLADCQVKVIKVIDLRRYNLMGADYPAQQTYLMFGYDEKAFLSHIPSKCADFQELLELSSLPRGIPEKMLAQGIVITFPELKGSPSNIDGRVSSYLRSSGTYKFTTRDLAKEWQPLSLTVKKVIAFDNIVFNIGC